MQDHLGVIHGAVGESRFRFVASESGHLRNGDYVKVNHEEGVVLGQVLGILREGLRADEDRLVAEAIVIGYRDPRGLVQVPKSPFRPGERVYRADELLIERVLGLGGDGALLGHLRGSSLPVKLDINHLVQKHVSVLAKTGAGKSYIVGVLMEELLKRGIPIVIIDPHGEHSSLGEPNVSRQDMSAMRRFGVKPKGYAEAVIEYSPASEINRGALPLRLDGADLGFRELVDLIGSRLSSAQFGILHQALKSLQAAGGRYTLEQIVEEVKAHPSSSKWNLVAALEFLDGLNLFHNAGTPVSALAKRGQASIVNLRGVPPEIQEIVVTWLCKGLFEARKLNRIPPAMLVVEEAHHFCPERGFQQAISGDILRTIASEGRKFGLGLLIVSQRPAKVDKNVISQCGTQLILKVTNPNDLRAIISSVEGLASGTDDEIQGLPVGTAIVSHPRFPFPLQVEIRPRETKHGGRSVNVLGRWNAPEAGEADDEGGQPGDEAPPAPGPQDGGNGHGLAGPGPSSEAEGKAEAVVADLAEPSRADQAPAVQPPAPKAGPQARLAPRRPNRAPPRVEQVEIALELSEEPAYAVEDDEIEYPRPPGRIASPEETPAYLDIRRISERLDGAELATLSLARLLRLREELEALEPTVAGLALEFPDEALVAELREALAVHQERLASAIARARRRRFLDRLRGKG